MFIPLYPAGILSECWLIYNIIEPSRARQAYYQYLLWFGLLIYIPGNAAPPSLLFLPSFSPDFCI